MDKNEITVKTEELDKAAENSEDFTSGKITSDEFEKEGLFSTIEKGIFGGVKRPFDGGHGLEGVCTKGENYFNPFIELFLDHE